MKASIVIPVFNEAGTIEEILTRVLATPVQKEVIVVDDGSTDGTRERLLAWRARSDVLVLFHANNLGKGAALRTGFRHVSGDVVIVQDGDLEYDPNDYQALLLAFAEGSEVVYGSRFLSGKNKSQSYWNSVANRRITQLANLVMSLQLTDVETCYKAFRRDVLNKLTLESNGFGFDPEFTVKVARLGLMIREVPVSYHPRSFREGKKITWLDGLKAVAALFWFKYARSI